MTEQPSDADYARAFDTLDFLMGAVEAEAFQRFNPRAAGAADLSVVLVTGFLGAGKTTLMRRLVSGNHGVRLAAVVNDMANLNIDAALVAEAGYEHGLETLALANGCVCCSQSGGVAKTLAEIQTRPEPPDCVLLEASGVADPAALAGVVSGMEGVRLEAVVSVVDADAIVVGAESDPGRLIARGVGAADLILINKTDLVAPERAAALEQILTDMAPKAAILRTINCAVPPSLIFDLPARVAAEASEAELADDRFATVELIQTQALSRHDLEALFATVPTGVYRAKGTLRLADRPEPELLQAVGRRWSWAPAGEEASELAGRLVVIFAVDAGAVEAHFRPAFAIARQAVGLKLPAAG